MRARLTTTLSVALITACLLAGSGRAEDLGPEPPSAPTPDEALAAAVPADKPAMPAATAPSAVLSPAPKAPATPAPAAEATPPASPQPAASAGGSASPYANNETYKMKDGGMYQPPAVRPPSPAMDASHYGRT